MTLLYFSLFLMIPVFKSNKQFMNLTFTISNNEISLNHMNFYNLLEYNILLKYLRLLLICIMPAHIFSSTSKLVDPSRDQLKTKEEYFCQCFLNKKHRKNKPSSQVSEIEKYISFLTKIQQHFGDF